MLLTLFCLASSCSYLPEETSDIDGVDIREERSHYVLSPIDGMPTKKTAIIFYPGGLVDPAAYIPALAQLVKSDQRIVVVLKTTGNLAIMNPNLAAKVVDDENALADNWVIAGHSLGGVVAAMATGRNSELFAALIMQAAYASVDLSEWQNPMMIITGSEDEVFDSNDIGANKDNMPPLHYLESLDDLPETGTIGQTIVWEIEGGNHGQFGAYGFQEGDGEANITAEDQHLRVANAIATFLQSNNIE